MERVTAQTLDSFLDRYNKARGGELNEETRSEAMFVALGKYRGAYILNTGLGPLWVGVQNASARWSDNGKPFSSVRTALESVMTSNHPTATGTAVFYSEDSAALLRWLSEQLEEFKKSGDFLLWA